MVVDIPDVVKYANFGDHRLRGFWVAGGQISPSPIDFHRRPYNTLALPRERVIRQNLLLPCDAVLTRYDMLSSYSCQSIRLSQADTYRNGYTFVGTRLLLTPHTHSRPTLHIVSISEHCASRDS